MTAFAINPDIIPWACQRLDISLAEFARAMHVSEHVMEGWRSGERKPSLLQARQLADKLLIPLGYLVLKKMPRITLDAVDFRTVGNRRVNEPSLELWATYNMALSRQEWYRDCAVENEYEPCSCVGSISQKTPVKKAVETIHMALGNLEMPQNIGRTWEKRFSGLVNAIEEKAGIMVMRNSMVGNNSHKPLSVAEFRGFAIPDKLAPLIFINGQDSKNAQLFTLVHELVHIFLGKGGISQQDYLEAPVNAVERYCNQVAAEYLVPADSLRQSWREQESRNQSEPYEKIKRLAVSYQVSGMVMIIRCRSLGLLNCLEAQNFWRLEVEALHRIQSARHGGGNPYQNIANRISRLFARSIIWQAESMEIQLGDAFKLLGVKNYQAMRRLSEVVGAAS
jgi:Zn-dependent peptidase ImmA (M78 family)/transcriptional regulator with XRE-family HTH domain